MLGEVEEVELPPEHAVVARLRLLEPREMRLEVALVVERRPVDPGQLRVLLVAAPVGAGEARELDRLDRRGVLQVRPAAEVGELALRVQRDVALGGVDELDLVRLALGLEALLRLVAGDLLTRPRAPLLQLACRARPRSSPGRPRGSARGTRSRSRSRSRSAGRSRSSRPGRAAAPPRRAGARSSGAGRRARPGRACRAWSGSGSARPSASGARRSRRSPFERTSTACSASFGPIARAASRPVAPSGSSSSLPSGRTTFMTTEDTHPREDDNDGLGDRISVPDSSPRNRRFARSGPGAERRRRRRSGSRLAPQRRAQVRPVEHLDVDDLAVDRVDDQVADRHLLAAAEPALDRPRRCGSSRSPRPSTGRRSRISSPATWSASCGRPAARSPSSSSAANPGTTAESFTRRQFAALARPGNERDEGGSYGQARSVR